MGAGTRVFTYSGDACHSAKVMLDLAGVICTFNIVPVSMIVMMPRSECLQSPVCCLISEIETPLV